MPGFQLTYSTMFAAPPELHELFDRALVRVGKAQGREHALFIGGCDVFTDRKSFKRSPIDQRRMLANTSEFGLTAGFYGGADEIEWFFENIEAGVTYANRSLGATTGAWPGYQAFAGWKGSSSTGKAIGSFYYLPQYMREQSQTHIG